ncbi:MAG: ParA family protein [Actinomycetota bacterium]|nr:ParA family protein [Actinomycetota bacterium]
MTVSDQIPKFPHVTAAFRDDDNVEVTVLGVSHMFEGPAGIARTKALQFLWKISASDDFNRPLRVHTDTIDGAVTSLIVTPDGRFYDESDPTNTWPLNSQDPAEATTAEASTEDPPRAQPGFTAAPTPPDASAPGVETEKAGAQLLAGPSVPRHHERKSFIADGPVLAPASQGWRGAVNRMGMRLDPGVPEVAWREDVKLVSQHWPGPRTIAVVNGKGSANKTPTTVMLAAVLARYGGAGVLAWDNNETRGSLAWRTQRSNHTSTVLDLLPQADALLGTGAQSAEMSYFAHHQPEDKFDVLHSDQSVDGEHEVSGAEVEAIHRVAAKYYRMIIMDSGNNERAVNWRAMIERTQQLVVPCTNVEDTAEAGARMLEALANRDDHSKKLAQNAVAIISKRTPGKDPNMDRIVRDFAPLVREVVTIPYDKALVSGVIHFDAMQPATKRAWLRAAAAVAKGL